MIMRLRAHNIDAVDRLAVTLLAAGAVAFGWVFT